MLREPLKLPSMMMDFLKAVAARLPKSWQHELKRHYFRSQIRRNSFEIADPQCPIWCELISDGDWVIDVGANVGQYTKRFSDLVGPNGRVIAVEPVPDTFALLAANVALFKYRNVTSLNLAASDKSTVVGMEIPVFDTGLSNYYTASITTQEAALQVMTLALDSLAPAHRIGLIKVDAEGHDPLVIGGAERLITRDHPALIVETVSPELIGRLSSLGYRHETLPGSQDSIFRWQPHSKAVS